MFTIVVLLILVGLVLLSGLGIWGIVRAYKEAKHYQVDWEQES